MTEGFIGKQIARTNRNLLISGVIILGAVAASAAAVRRYYVNYFAGPATITEQTLAHALSADALSRYYVNVEGDDVIETGYTHITKKMSKHTHRELSRETDAVYVVIALGDHMLLVKSPKTPETPRVTGYLTDLDNSVDRQVLEKVRADAGSEAGRLLPMMLDATGFRTRGTVGLCFLVLFALLGLRNIRAALVRGADHQRHPIWKRLTHIGNADDLAHRINDEIDRAEKVAPRVLLTPSRVLLRRTLFGMEVLRLEDLVWAYKKVTKNKRAFITISKSFEAILIDRWNEKLEIGLNERNADHLLQVLGEKAPWAITGWSDDVESRWKTSRPEIIAAVDERRHAQSFRR